MDASNVELQKQGTPVIVSFILVVIVATTGLISGIAVLFPDPEFSLLLDELLNEMGLVIDQATLASIATAFVIGNIIVIAFSVAVLVLRKLYFLSMGCMIGSIISQSFFTIIACIIFTFFIFKRWRESRTFTTSSVDDSTVSLNQVRTAASASPNDRATGDFSTPRFCVFCGTPFPDKMAVKMCIACGRSIPLRFRPSLVSLDREVSFCIYCGEFLDQNAFLNAECNQCRRKIPCSQNGS